MCSFTGLNLAERGVILCSFTLPYLLEWSFNESSFSGFLFQADLGVHEFSLY